jgi:hypothetical protein
MPVTVDPSARCRVVASAEMSPSTQSGILAHRLVAPGRRRHQLGGVDLG